MQRSGAATRRFYAAFYQLTVRSANPTRPCVAGASLVSRRANSTMSKRTDFIRSGSPRKTYPMKSFPGTTQLLERAPVQSTTDLPQGSLEAWGHAVRDRSSDGVTLELSVPGWALRAPDVTRSARTYEVQVREPDNQNVEGDFDLRPVLLSGLPDDVKAVWRTIHDTGSREVPRSPALPAKITIPNPRPLPWRYIHGGTRDRVFDAFFCIPESAWRPLAEHGCIQWFQQDFGVQTEVLGVRDSFTYLRLKGERHFVTLAINRLQQANRWTDSEAVERYNSIRRSVEQGSLPSSVPLEKPSGFNPREDSFKADQHRSETKVRIRRFAVPEPLPQFEDPQSGLMAQIQQIPGIKAIRWRPMAGSRHYLQLLGTDPALELAMAMLEEHLCAFLFDRSSGKPARIDQLRIPESDFQPAETTHFAWVKVPDGPVDMSAIIPDMKRSLRAADCTIEQFRAGGRADLMLRGTEEAVNFAILGCQESMNIHRAHLGYPSAKPEIHKMGLIQDISKLTPWEDLASVELDRGTAAADPLAGLRLMTASEYAAQKKTRVSSASAGRVTNRREHAAASNRNNIEAEPRPSDPDAKQENLRYALRHLTQPVAVVTSTMPKKGRDEKVESEGVESEGIESEGVESEGVESEGVESEGVESGPGPRGVTVSSFCSVSFDPEPVISFNLRVPSRTWEAILATRNMNVILLAASRRGAAVAHAFTQPYEHPSEPFEFLEAKGASVTTGPGLRSPPGITWRNAVYATIQARLLKKSVLVGDHMIVVARVNHVRLEGESTNEKYGGLAYSMRGYRRLGDEMTPWESRWPVVEPVNTQPKTAKPHPAKTEPTELSTDESQDLWKGFMEDFMEDFEKGDRTPAETQGSPANQGQEGQPSSDVKDVGPSSPIMDEESLRHVLSETEASYATKGLPSKTANENPMLAEALKAAAGAYDESPNTATTPTASTLQNADTIVGPASDASEKKKRNERPHWIMRGKKKPFERTFSTWTRSQNRSYSTSTSTSPDPSNKKTLNSTVEDFLCQIPTNNRLYNNLIAAQREAEKLESQVADGKIPAHEIAQVQNESQAIRRRVARELAWRNAQDLRVLLDQGHVGSERAQWLETSLEEGQAILLQEAKLLRAELEKGRLVEEEFEGAKAALMRDYEEFEGLLKRLRDFVDEDDVGGQQDEAGSSRSGRP
jgi:flavin reductase (DIM6/NTAB) family NADH-FMN oxidoreductase RutF